MDRKKHKIVDYSCSEDSTSSSDSDEKKIHVDFSHQTNQNAGFNFEKHGIPAKIRRVAVIHPQVQSTQSTSTPPQQNIQQIAQSQPIDYETGNNNDIDINPGQQPIQPNSPYYPYPYIPSPVYTEESNSEEDNYPSQTIPQTTQDNPIVISSDESIYSQSDDQETIIYTPPHVDITSTSDSEELPTPPPANTSTVQSPLSEFTTFSQYGKDWVSTPTQIISSTGSSSGSSPSLPPHSPDVEIVENLPSPTNISTQETNKSQ